MSDVEEETYSIIFTSLRHPVRRKILRMLSEKPRNFSKILEELVISSSHLTYHLENLGELVSKMEDGRYRLSTFGEAAVITMRGVEEVPVIKPEHLPLLLTKWKTFFAVLMIGLVILAGVSYIQYTSLNQMSSDYQKISEMYEQLEAEFEQVSAEHERLLSWSISTNEVFTFLEDVVHLNMTKYYATLVSNTVEYRSVLGGIAEETLKYSLTHNEDKLDVTFRFRNNTLFRYSLYVLEGSPLYTQPQPTNVLDMAKGLLDRYENYTGVSYVQEMRYLLETVDVIKDMTTTSGNVKLNISTEGDDVEIQWIYTSNGIDFQAKSVGFSFDNGFLETLDDGWFLFKVGSTDVNVSKEEAINIATNYAKNFSWNVDGVEVTDFNILEDPVSADLVPHVREEPLVLIPYWYVTLYLDKVYPGNVNRIAVGLWADTAEVNYCKALSG
jgi:DNA-binding transcriptional ArsR family regulator